MDLKSRKIDPVRQEQGAWVDKIPEWGDLRLKVRGINNSDYQILQESLISERPRLDRLRGSIPKEEREHITATLLLDTVLRLGQCERGRRAGPVLERGGAEIPLRS